MAEIPIGDAFDDLERIIQAEREHHLRILKDHGVNEREVRDSIGLFAGAFLYYAADNLPLLSQRLKLHKAQRASITRFYRNFYGGQYEHSYLYRIHPKNGRPVIESSFTGITLPLGPQMTDDDQLSIRWDALAGFPLSMVYLGPTSQEKATDPIEIMCLPIFPIHDSEVLPFLDDAACTVKFRDTPSRVLLHYSLRSQGAFKPSPYSGTLETFTYVGGFSCGEVLWHLFGLNHGDRSQHTFIKGTLN